MASFAFPFFWVSLDKVATGIMARGPWSSAYSAASCLCDERRPDEVLREQESGIIRCSGCDRFIG
jgi:hypothetical protein